MTAAQDEAALLHTLSTTGDATVRNAAAIALADRKSVEGIKKIKLLLRDPVTAGARGSLLYALHEAQVKLPLRDIVSFIISDAPEAREEALSFLDDGMVQHATPTEIRRAIARLKVFVSVCRDTEHLALARDVLKSLRPPPLARKIKQVRKQRPAAPKSEAA